MADRPCPNVVNECECDDWPLLNRSSEGPDPAICFGIVHFEIYPRLGRTWQAADCLDVCVNEAISACQIEANYCAQVKALNCRNDCEDPPCNPQPPCPGSPGCTDDRRVPEPCQHNNFGNPVNGSTAASLPANVKRFVRFTAPSNLTVVESLSFELNRTGTGTGYAVSAGIYTDNSGAPDALVADSYIQVSSDVKRADPMWYTATYTGAKPQLTAGDAYWIGVIAELEVATYHDAGDANQLASAADVYGDGLANPFGGATFENLIMSAYVCYKTGIYNERQCAPPQLCPDGYSVAGFCVDAGTIPGTSVAEANMIAMSIAVEQTRLRQICLSEILKVCCLGQSYNQSIEATGESVASPGVNLWQFYGGVLPPGLTFNGGQIQGSASITGIATTAGSYPFTLQVTAPNGASVTKNYEIDVMGILTSTLPDALPGTPYSTGLVAAGFSGAVTWAFISGSLPTGLSLNTGTGVISGTPTEIGDFTFTIQASDGTNACQKTFQISSFTYSGIRLNAWKAWCGYTTLLGDYSPNDCSNPPAGTCPQLPISLECDERWLKKRVRSVWNNPYYADPEKGPGVDDVTDSYFNRLDPACAEITLPTVSSGPQTGDAYDQALAAPGGIKTDDVNYPFIWNVIERSSTQFTVEISFYAAESLAFFHGFKYVTLSQPYLLKDLQQDLIDLWASVDTNNYPWVDGFVDVFAAYDDAEHDWAKIQYSDQYPALTLTASSVRAKSHCDLQDQPLVPPLLSGDTDYHAGWLLTPSCPAQPYPCINLVKTIFRYRGLLCQTDFTRPLPIGALGACSDPPYDPNCDHPWNAGVTTHLLPTTLVPFTVLPIAATDTTHGVYQPGVRKISRNCNLIDWWKMEEIGGPSVDRVGAKDFIHLASSQSGGGTIGDTVFGKIDFGIELTSPGAETEILASAANLPAFAYGGDTYVNGMEICGWFKVSLSPNPALDTISFRLTRAGWSFDLNINGGNITASAANGAATGSVVVPFNAGAGPTVADWYFFRVWYDAINVQVGFQINDGTIYLGNVSGPLAATPDGQLELSFLGGTAFNPSTIILDEISVWNSHLSSDIAAFLYNSGAGRTFPFT